MSKYCWDHELEFPTVEAYQKHKSGDCERLLALGKVCLYLGENGECCGQSFRHISSLMLHYKGSHNKQACVHCYAIFDSLEALEQHEHVGRKGVREGK